MPDYDFDSLFEKVDAIQAPEAPAEVSTIDLGEDSPVSVTEDTHPAIRTALGLPGKFNFWDEYIKETDKQQARRNWELARQLKIPLKAIEIDPARFEHEFAAANFDADAVARESPVLAGFLAENPEHPAALFNDTRHLAKAEGVLSILENIFSPGTVIGTEREHPFFRKARIAPKQAYRVGVLQGELSDLALKEMNGQPVLAEDLERRAEIRTLLEEHQRFHVGGVYVLDKIAEQIPNLMGMATRSMAGATAFGLGALVTGVGAPAAPGFAATGAAVGLFDFGLEREASLVFDRARADGASYTEALVPAMAAGALSASLDLVGAKGVGAGITSKVRSKWFGGKTAEALHNDKLADFGRHLVKQSAPAARAQGGHVANAIAALGQGEAQVFLGATRVASKRISHFSFGVLKEGATEGTQEIITEGAAVIGEMAGKGELENASAGEVAGRILDRMTDPKTLVQALEAAKAGAAVAFGLGGAGMVVNLPAEIDAARTDGRRADLAMANLQEVVDNVAKTEAVNDSPGLVKQVLERTAVGKGTVYLSVDGLNAIAAQQGVTPGVVAEAYGIKEKYARALRDRSGSIPMDASEYIIKRAQDGGIDVQVDQHVTLSPDMVTAAEAKASLDALQKRREATADARTDSKAETAQARITKAEQEVAVAEKSAAAVTEALGTGEDSKAALKKAERAETKLTASREKLAKARQSLEEVLTRSPEPRSAVDLHGDLVEVYHKEAQINFDRLRLQDVISDIELSDVIGDAATRRRYIDIMHPATDAGVEIMAQGLERTVAKEIGVRNAERSDQIDADVRAEVLSEPAFGAAQALRTGQLTTDDGTVIKNFRVNRKSLRDIAGDWVDGKGKKRKGDVGFAPGMTSNTGMPVESVMQHFGYTNAAKFAHEVRAVPRSIDKVIRERAEIRKEHEGTLYVNESEMRERAREAYLLDPNLAKEAQEIQKFMVSEEFSLFNKLGSVIARQPKATSAIAHDVHKEMQSMLWLDVNPRQYVKAIKKTGIAAIEAFTKAKTTEDASGRRVLYGEAFDLVRERARLIEEHRQAVEINRRFEKGVSLNRKLNGAAFKRRLGRAYGLPEAIDVMRQRAGFDVKDSLADNFPFDSIPEMLAEFTEQTGTVVFNIDPTVYETGGVLAENATVRQRLAVLEAIDSLTKLSTAYDGQQRAQRLAERGVNLENLTASIIGNARKKKAVPTVGKGAVRRLTDFLALANGDMTQMQFMVQQLDDGAALGPAQQALLQRVQDNLVIKARRVREISVTLRGLIKKTWSTKGERAELWAVGKWVPELNMAINQWGLVALAGNWGNPSSREAVLAGYAHLGWTEEKVQSVLDTHLEPKHGDFVQDIWNLAASIRDEYGKMSRDSGAGAPIWVQGGTTSIGGKNQQGGYWPLKPSPDKELHRGHSVALEMGEARAVEHALEVTRRFSATTTPRQHLKSRKGFTSAVDLSFVPMQEYFNDAIHDIVNREAVADISYLLQDTDLFQAIKDSVGAEKASQIRPWLAAVARGNEPVPVGTFIDGLSATARPLAVIGAMFFKASVGIIQLSGAFITLAEAGPAYFARGFQSFMSGMASTGLPTVQGTKGFFTELMKKSGVIERRILGGAVDRDVATMFTDMGIPERSFGWMAKFHNRHKSWIKKYGMMFTMAMDAVVSATSFLAGYHKALDGKVDGIEPGDEVAASQHGDSMILLTQGSGDTPHLSRVQRMNKILTTFMQFGAMFYNQLERTFRLYKIDGNPSKALLHLATIWIIPSVIESLYRDGLHGPDDFDDGDAGFIKHWAKKVGTYPAQSVPVLRDMVASIEFGVRPTPTLAFGLSAARGFADIPGAISTKLEGDDLGKMRRRDLLNTLGVFSFPAGEASVIINGLVALEEGRQVPDNFVDALRQFVIFGEDRDINR